MKRLVILLLCAAVFCGVWADAGERAVAGKLLRLHVVANSDSQADQREKLAARDRVLAAAGALLADAESVSQAEAILGGSLDALAAAAGEDATAEISEKSFPTKSYGLFSLPAGEYTALTVTLGEGAGRNWWCVLFPPLCLGSATENDLAAAGFTKKDIALITGGEGYVIKFKILELWGRLTGGLRNEE